MTLRALALPRALAIPERRFALLCLIAIIAILLLCKGKLRTGGSTHCKVQRNYLEIHGTVKFASLNCVISHALQSLSKIGILGENLPCNYLPL